MADQQLKAILSFKTTGQERATKALKDVGKAGQTAEQGIKKSSKAMDLLNVTIGNFVAGNLVKLQQSVVRFAKESAEAFLNFEDSMNEVFTLMPNISDRAMGKMGSQVLELTKKMGRLSDEVVPALYQSLSAGVPRNNVFEFLEQAHQAALGGVTDLETAVDGITSVINAYGVEVIAATEASDQMFTAVRLGKTTFGELSDSVSQFTPLASALGVAFSDTMAAMAAMTSQGTDTRIAATQLRALLQELSQEGTIVNKAFQDVAGMGFAEFISQGNNLQDALGVIEVAAINTNTPIQDMFGNIRAGMAALQLTGKGTDTFTGNLEEMQESMGATADAAERMGESTKRAVEEAAASVESMKIAFGEAAAVLISGTAEGQKGVAGFLENIARTTTAYALFETQMDELGRGGLITNAYWHAVTNTQEGAINIMEKGDRAMRRQAIAIQVLKEGWEGTGHPGEWVDELRVLIDTLEASSVAIEETAAASEAAAGADALLGMKMRDTSGDVNDADRQFAKYADTLGSWAQVHGRTADNVGEMNDKLAQQEHMLSDAAVASIEHRQQIEADGQAAIEAAVAHEKLIIALAKQGDLFGKAVSGNLSFFNEDLEDLGEQMVWVTDASVSHQAQVRNLQAEYDAANQTLNDYQTFAKGATLSDEERAKKIEETQEQVGILGQRLQEVGAIEGDWIAKNVEATVNMEAVNKALFESVDAAGGSAEQLAILGMVTGQFTEDQANAALRVAALQLKVESLAEAYVNGTKTIGGIRSELETFISDLDNIVVPEIKPPAPIDLELKTETFDRKMLETDQTVAALVEFEKEVTLSTNADEIDAEELTPFEEHVLLLAENGPYPAELETNALDLLENEITPFRDSVDGYVEEGPYIADMEADTAEAMENTRLLTEAANAAERTYTLTYRIVTVGSPPSGSNSTVDVPGGQHGISDFMVPPGHANDSFLFAASSYEVVNIATRGQQAEGGNGGSLSIGNLHLNFMNPVDADPDQLAQMVAGRLGDMMRG
jgi:TP901 family phage tail tape measure protein